MFIRNFFLTLTLTLVAAATVHAAADSQRIIPRSEWGAEVKYLYDGTTAEESAASDTGKGDNGSAVAQPSARADTCQQAVKNYPAEFAVGKTVTKDGSGKQYRWPLTYSKEIKLLVVHHTALLVRDDPRKPEERMRALFKYHAVSNGWGDIGYNYVIDEDGSIYEGRQGGARVIGGHAYCNNVGTIGIALMGNFELEQPSQAQAKSLQWLISKLAKEEGIDVSRSVQFHGKVFSSPIVGHQDLLSTACPGGVLKAGFAQIIRNVINGSVDAAVTFPAIKKPASSSSSSSAASSPSESKGLAQGVRFLGRTEMTMNPGGKQRLSFTYTAGPSGMYEGKKIAEVLLGSPDIHLSVDDGFNQIEVRKGILLPFDLPAEETTTIQLILQAPPTSGEYWLEIGGQRFTLAVSGRRARTGNFVSPFYTNPAMVVKAAAPKKSTGISIRTRLPLSSPSSSVRSPSSTAIPSSSNRPIRILLSASSAPTITFSGNGTMNGILARAGMTLTLRAADGNCVAQRIDQTVGMSPVLRFASDTSDTLMVDAVRGKKRSYAGIIECRVIQGKITLINELPLDQYMMGLAEEPDTELFEKQKAFSVAARTYAAFYMQDAARKFPGMPYDGSDDPAVFQSYAGVDFGAFNPRWLEAAKATARQVLTVQGSIIKPPYFSSDDGRTRTPAEAGWKNFPFAEIFSSKPDPWCKGLLSAGHGVGMSGCGAKGQALEGRSAEQILQYYYPGTRLTDWKAEH
ncbi:MAG: N-acetylmuramoyl-L-alanine amidase [Candidatus Peribacteraceae bacterium]|nr:N-acetylmuramoyl-L-alanine amidase [Candidatus Peribacteraceae bacterium]